jgi:hypothetical protein
LAIAAACHSRSRARALSAHQRQLDQLGAAIAVGLQADDALVDEHVADVASSFTDSSSASAMTGMPTLQVEVAQRRAGAGGDVASLPMTCGRRPASPTSQITGLTLPGMMDEPGWIAGSFSSPMPQRGPEPSQRMSLAILLRLTAMVLRCPRARRTRPCVLGLEVVVGFVEGVARRGFVVQDLADLRGEVGSVLMPVPTAVPPMGSSQQVMILASDRGDRRAPAALA